MIFNTFASVANASLHFSPSELKEMVNDLAGNSHAMTLGPQSKNFVYHEHLQFISKDELGKKNKNKRKTAKKQISATCARFQNRS